MICSSKDSRTRRKVLTDTIKALGHAPRATVVGVESTGVYHLLFATRLTAAGYSLMLINPLESHRFIAARTLRDRKTDEIDAKAIRAMVLAGVGRPFVETDEVLALKALVAERDGLVGLRSTMKQHREARTVRSHAISQPLRDPSVSIMYALDTEIQLIQSQFPLHAPATQQLLRSIPGIGAISAATLIAHIGDIRRFSSPEKLVAYVGLDCRVHQSGTSVNGRGFISKRGNPRLRTILFNAAFIARQRNPEMKTYFDKKIREGKHYTAALVAIERKLVHLVYAVWTRGTPYEPRPVSSRN
jgi:transposase